MNPVIMSYKITTLVDNVVYDRGLQAEHGLSLLIGTGDKKILFDTGASTLFIRNAEILGIDLNDIDYLVLSHGHSDHTGGVKQFLELNSHAKVVCKKETLQKKYKDERENGFKEIDQLDESRLWLVDSTTEIVPGVYVLPQIKITEKSDTHFEHFFTVQNGDIIPDTFEDELALVLADEKNLSVLSSCSHRGITNIIRSAQEAFPERALNVVIGGFHIHNSGEEKFSVISTYLGRRLPRRLGVCHCTGIDNYARFHQEFSTRVFYNYTGWVEEIK